LFKKNYLFFKLSEKGNLNSIDITTDPDAGDKMIAYLENNLISPAITLDSNDEAVVKVTVASDIIKASLTSDTTLTWEKRKSYSFTMDTMLVSCFFNDIQCSASDFKVI
jgi:hypothetical protein